MSNVSSPRYFYLKFGVLFVVILSLYMISNCHNTGLKEITSQEITGAPVLIKSVCDSFTNGFSA